MDIRLAVLFTLGLAYTASALHSKYNKCVRDLLLSRIIGIPNQGQKFSILF